MPLSRTSNATQVANDEALSPEQLALLERARADGWVTQDQILAATPDAETNLDNLDELMAALQEAGILVLESPGRPWMKRHSCWLLTWTMALESTLRK